MSERGNALDVITPFIGRILDTSYQRCGFSPDDTDTTTCDAPAAWHICWGVDMENGLSCGTHMLSAQRYAYLDRHRISPDCSMPGSAWEFTEHRCVIAGATPSDSAALALSSPLEAS